ILVFAPKPMKSSDPVGPRASSGRCTATLRALAGARGASCVSREFRAYPRSVMQLRFFTVLPLLGFAACNQDQAGVEVLDQTALGPAGPQGTLVMSQNPPTQPVSDPEQPM